MRDVTSSLIAFMKGEIEGPKNASKEAIFLRAWTAWKVSVAFGEVFGARSFGLIALNIIFSVILDIEQMQYY